MIEQSFEQSFDRYPTNGTKAKTKTVQTIDRAGLTNERGIVERNDYAGIARLITSPMIDARARQVAKRLGIETYGDSTEVELV